MRKRSLSELPPEKSAVIAEIWLGGSVRRRLLELGAIPGTRVTCLHRAPAGSPAAYQICGAAIAIRKSDAENILVEPWD